MHPPAHTADPPSARTPREFRLEAGATVALFVWNGDRWAHRLVVDGPSPTVTRPPTRPVAPGATDWESLEGPRPCDADPCWPASPVLVELSRVEPPRTGGGSAVAGVGKAGRSHFSASFAVDPERADTIRIEIACRVHEPPVWLGSTYRHGDRLVRLIAGDAAVALPTTVAWAYRIGPGGVAAIRGVKAVETAAVGRS